VTGAQRPRLAKAGRAVRNVPRPNLIERRMSKFLQEPPSVRVAAGVIVTATTVVVVGSGVLMRVLDHREYANVWVGMWWALQTVTTVGYGDVTPAAPIGRAVASFVMLEGIAFLAIITAAITSTFVARAASERAATEGADEAAFEQRVEARLDEFGRRFDELQAILRDRGGHCWPKGHLGRLPRRLLRRIRPAPLVRGERSWPPAAGRSSGQSRTATRPRSRLRWSSSVSRGASSLRSCSPSERSRCCSKA